VNEKVGMTFAGAQELNDLLVREGDCRVVRAGEIRTGAAPAWAVAALAALEEGDPTGVRVAGGGQVDDRTALSARACQCGLGGFTRGLLGLRGGRLLGDLLSRKRRRRRYVQRVVDVFFGRASAGDNHDGDNSTHRKEREPGPDLSHTAHLCLVCSWGAAYQSSRPPRTRSDLDPAIRPNQDDYHNALMTLSKYCDIMMMRK